jgi:hypothetical protein
VGVESPQTTHFVTNGTVTMCVESPQTTHFVTNGTVTCGCGIAPDHTLRHQWDSDVWVWNRP